MNQINPPTNLRPFAQATSWSFPALLYWDSMLPCLNHLSSSCAKALKCFLLSSPFTVKFSSFYSLFSFARGALHTKVWAIKIIWKCFPNINYRVRQPPTTSPSLMHHPLLHDTSMLYLSTLVTWKKLYELEATPSTLSNETSL